MFQLELKITTITVIIVLVSLLFLDGAANSGEKNKTIFDFAVKDIDGKDVALSQYRGKVILLVNVASKCGYTSQYDGLQKIYAEYKDLGFVVLGFPANNFNGQEPGTNEEIKEFCQLNYGVEFPMFSKISVKGEDIHPLYKYLISEEASGRYAGEITWNFNKFLVNRSGKVIGRFASKDKPESEKVTSAIEKAIK